MLVELYRRDHVTHHDPADTLGLARLEVDELLKRHDVTEDLHSSEELAAQVENPRRLVGA